MGYFAVKVVVQLVWALGLLPKVSSSTPTPFVIRILCVGFEAKGPKAGLVKNTSLIILDRIHLTMNPYVFYL